MGKDRKTVEEPVAVEIPVESGPVKTDKPAGPRSNLLGGVTRKAMRFRAYFAGKAAQDARLKGKAEELLVFAKGFGLSDEEEPSKYDRVLAAFFGN